MAQTVTVGCKLPNGVIIHLHEKQKNGDQVIVNIKSKVQLKGVNEAEIVGQNYGLTEVDKDFWDAWIAENKDFAPVTAGAIFAQDTAAKAKAEAKEKESEKSGFEGIDPDKPGKGVKKADK